MVMGGAVVVVGKVEEVEVGGAVGEGVVERRMVIMVVVVLLPRDAASVGGEEVVVGTSQVVALGRALVRPRCSPKHDPTAVQPRRQCLHP